MRRYLLPARKYAREAITLLILGLFTIGLGVLTRGNLVAQVVAAVVAAAAAALAVAWLFRPRTSARLIGPRARMPSKVQARPYLVPRELPPAPRGFAGRKDEREWLESALAEWARKGAAAIAVHGAAGIGKSTLAITFAHQVADRFPDGQLYARLWRSPKVTVADLMAYVIRALQQPGEQPPKAQDQAGRYAELTRDKAVLILLDDVPAALDIAELRPGGPRSLLLVTRREPLGREDVIERELGPLREREALDLLRAVIGPARDANITPQAEEKHLAELASTCDGQPLMLRLVATAVAQRPDWTLERITEQAKTLQLITCSRRASWPRP